MKYLHKTTGQEVEAITFDELIEHGRQQNPGREGIPWFIEWSGFQFSREKDDCYDVNGVLFFQGECVHIDPGTKRLMFYETPLAPDEWEPVVAPTETEMIEATEKSATFMLGLAARAREALRREELVEEQRVAIARLQDRVHVLFHTCELRKAAVQELRQALDAEGYDLPALATMAIQKIRDLDRCLTESKGEVKLINRDRVNLRESAVKLREQLANLERHIEQEHVSAWRMLQAALPEPQDTESRSLVQRVIDAIESAPPAPAEDKMFQQLQSIRNYHAAEVARNGTLMDWIDTLRAENGRQAATIAAMAEVIKQH